MPCCVFDSTNGIIEYYRGILKTVYFLNPQIFSTWTLPSSMFLFKRKYEYPPLGQEMSTHSSILAWRIPWTEEPGGLQSMGWQGVTHDWVTNTHTWVPYLYKTFPVMVQIMIFFHLMPVQKGNTFTRNLIWIWIFSGASNML